MKVAVTGGAGFIGRATVQALWQYGHESVTLDKQHGFDVRVGIEHAWVGGCDTVVHLAGVLGTSVEQDFRVKNGLGGRRFSVRPVVNKRVVGQAAGVGESCSALRSVGSARCGCSACPCGRGLSGPLLRS